MVRSRRRLHAVLPVGKSLSTFPLMITRPVTSFHLLREQSCTLVARAPTRPALRKDRQIARLPHVRRPTRTISRHASCCDRLDGGGVHALLLAVILVRRHPVRGDGHPRRVGIAFARTGEFAPLLIRDHCRVVGRLSIPPAHHWRLHFGNRVVQGLPDAALLPLKAGPGSSSDETAQRPNRATQALVMPWSRQGQASLGRRQATTPLDNSIQSAGESQTGSVRRTNANCPGRTFLDLAPLGSVRMVRVPGDHGLAPATTGGTAGIPGPATRSCMAGSINIGGSGVQNLLRLPGGARVGRAALTADDRDRLVRLPGEAELGGFERASIRIPRSEVRDGPTKGHGH